MYFWAAAIRSRRVLTGFAGRCSECEPFLPRRGIVDGLGPLADGGVRPPPSRGDEHGRLGILDAGADHRLQGHHAEAVFQLRATHAIGGAVDRGQILRWQPRF